MDGRTLNQPDGVCSKAAADLRPALCKHAFPCMLSCQAKHSPAGQFWGQTAGDSVIRTWNPKVCRILAFFMGFWAIILPTFGGLSLGKPESSVMFAISVLPDHLPCVRQSHELRRAAVRISSPPTRAPRLSQHLEQARV